ncbi:S41 family peptidase [Corallococcus sp. EGB]|uniref:S41 family peptidase n=1 Tax=Corallococcus sp. EGB TaxID=1521117 RepID=UPI001CC0F809|nr:S41 family peptidase [Corallococcus sp. EGB]
MPLPLLVGALLTAAAPSLPDASAARGPYLDRQLTGAAYCYDPESPLLREAFRRPKPAPDARVDSAALAEDVRFLHQLLRTTYSGWPELLAHRTFDPDAFFQHWSAKVAASGPTVSFQEGVLAPTIAIREALTDSHFGPSGMLNVLREEPRLVFHEYQADAPPGLPLASCDANTVDGAQADTLRVAPVLKPDGSRGQRLTVSARGGGETRTLQCGATSVPLTVRPGLAPRKFEPKDTYTYEPKGDVGIITIRRFSGPPEAEAGLRQFVSDAPRHRKHKLLVFDLRGNSGGDDGYVYEWLDAMVRGPWFSSGEVWMHGAFFPCFQWNTRVQRQAMDGWLDTPEAKAEREAIQPKWPVKPEPSRPVFDSGRVEGHAKTPFTGRIVVLVDRDSASSGESGAYALHRATGAPMVGERTSGFLTYGNAPSFVLPRTGFAWVVPNKRNYFDAPVEGVGHAVQVYLDAEDMERPVAELLPRLRKLP